MTTVRFSVLGPVRAWHQGLELDLGSPQQRVVMAALLLRRGQHVTLTELVDAVWGVDPPHAAVPVLRTYISRLRKVLEPGRDAAVPPRTILSVGDGYRALVPEGMLDLAVFEQRIADAARAFTAGDEPTAAQLLHDALDDWRGVALAGLHGPLADGERARLAEKRLTTLEKRLALDIRLGRHREVVGELLSLTGEHPLREELCRLSMLALYRSGRQVDALRAYHRARAILVAELGVEPGPSVRDIQARILASDVTLLPAFSPGSSPPHQEGPSTITAPESRLIAGSSATQSASAETAPSGAANTQAARESRHIYAQGERQDSTSIIPGQRSPHDIEDKAFTAVRTPYAPRLAQLPADLPTFTGRTSELKQALGLLTPNGTRPAALTIYAIGGMAGIGKTTLAVHLAHRIADCFPDGQLCINLRGFDPTGSVMPPQEAIRILLGALGVPPQRLPADFEAQTALYRSMVTQRRVLILLDNAHDSDQVRPLLPGSPGCLVIVTSRNQLTGLVAGEGAYPMTLNQMESTEAHVFLARRIGAERLAKEPQAAAAIVAGAAALPLALAVVAARVATHPNFSLSAMAAELRDAHDSLDGFAGEDATTDLRSIFSTSYNDLSVPAARLFRLLGLHTGPDISAPAATALAGLTPRETRGLLAELTRAHLLTEHFPGRYTLHDLLRVYAAERGSTEETPQARTQAVHRLLSWYLHTADATYSLITPNRRRIPLEPPPALCRPLSFTAHDQALNWCETERSNLVNSVHQAAASGHPDIAWRLPAVLWGFFYLRSHVADWLDTSRTGLSAARAAHDRRGEAQALTDMAAALTSLDRYDDVIDHLHQAMTACRELEDIGGRARILGNLGDAYLQTGQLDKAVKNIREALVLHRAVGNIWGEGISLSNLGDAYEQLGRFHDAVRCLEQSLVVLRDSGNRWVEGVTLDVLGTVHHRLGAHNRAVEYYQQALKIHQILGNRQGQGHTLGHLGNVQLAIGASEAACATYQQALTIFTEFDHPDATKIRRKLELLHCGCEG